MDGLGKQWNGLDGRPDAGWDEWIVQERNRTKILRVYYHLPSPTNVPSYLGTYPQPYQLGIYEWRDGFC